MDGWQAFAGAVVDGQILYAVIVTLIIGLILTGKLVPSGQVVAWRTAWEKSQETNHELVKQNAQLIEAGRTTTRVMDAIPKGGDSS